jgi:small GTP-binding protein
MEKQAKPEEKQGVLQRIKELEDELSTTKYNKRSQGHIGLIKAKIALLKEKQEKRIASKGGGTGFSIKRSGDATVIIVGFPSVGKSTLLNAITKARSATAAYAFTTLTCIPGLLEHKHAKIQVLDVPGIISGAASGTGRGKEVLACAQSADLVLLVVDVFHLEHLAVLQKEVYDAHLRLNKRKPAVRIVRKERGGIDIGSTVKLTKMDEATIKGIMQEFRLNNASVVLRDNIDADELIDVIEGNKKYVPSLTLLNKIDLVDEKELERVKKLIKPDICISAEQKINTEELKELIFQKLGFIRIYCKEQGKKADLEEPLIMKSPSTLRNVCEKLHREFVAKFTFARVWGKSAKFDGQVLRSLEHQLKDEDVVEIHTR